MLVRYGLLGVALCWPAVKGGLGLMIAGVLLSACRDDCAGLLLPVGSG